MLTNVAGTVSSVTIDGFGSVPIGAEGVNLYFDINGNYIPATDVVTIASVIMNVQSTGVYTVTVIGPVNHPTPGTIEEVLTLPVKITVLGISTEGATITIPVTITVQDDVPVLDLSGTQVTELFQTDADLSGLADTSDASISFFVNFGADGPSIVVGGVPAPTGMLYSLTATSGADSGLVDMLTGQPILLYTTEDGIIEGRAGAVDAPVTFTVSINSATGEITLDQIRSIQHTDPDNLNGGTDEVRALANGVLSVVAIATDGDLDQAENSFDLGGKLLFGDDVPVVDLTGNPVAVLVQTDANLTGNVATSDASISFVVNFGSDGPYISTGNIPTPNGLLYSLQTNTGADSGLVDMLTGQPILLYTTEDGIVEGRAGSATAPVSLTVSINSITGEITLDQIRSIRHEIQGNTTDGTDAVKALADGVLSVVAVATDGDKDQATNVFDLGGKLLFGDDVPTVTVDNPAQSLQGFTIEYKGGEAAYNNSFGYYIKTADGTPMSGIVLWNNVKDFAAGSSIMLPDGVTADQIGFFIIPNGNDLNDGLSENTPVTFALVDGTWTVMVNGEPLTGQDATAFFSDHALNIDSQSHLQQAPAGTEDGNQSNGNFNWEDLVINVGSSDKDYDDVNMNLNWNVPILVHDSEADTGTSVDTDNSALTNRFVFNFGADGEFATGGKIFGLEVGTSLSILQDTATGQNVLVEALSGTSVQGYVIVDGVHTPVYTISVSNDGVVTVEQYRAVLHPTNDPSEIMSIGDGVVNLTAIAVDGDKDLANNKFDIGRQINFQDVGPIAIEDSANLVAVQNLATGTTDSTFNILANDLHEGKTDGAQADVNWVRTGGDRTYDTTDFTETYDATGLVGSLTVSTNGDATYALDNLTAMALGEGATQTDVFSYQMADADTDTDIAKVEVTVVGVNDSPEFVTGEDSVQDLWVDKNTDGMKDDGEVSQYSSATDDAIEMLVHEDALSTGVRETDEQSEIDDISFGLVDPDIGDEPVAMFDVDAQLPVLMSGGNQVVWESSEDRTVLVGTVDSNEIIRVSLTGNYYEGYKTDVVFSGQIDHLNTEAGTSTDDDTVSVNFGIIATDRPSLTTGLTDTLTLTVVIEDDAPTTSVNDDQVVQSQNIVIANFAGTSATADTGIVAMGADGVNAEQTQVSQASFEHVPETVDVRFVTGVASDGTIFNVTSNSERLVFVDNGTGLLAYLESSIASDGTILEGSEPVLAVELDASATSYTFEILGAVDPYSTYETTETIVEEQEGTVLSTNLNGHVNITQDDVEESCKTFDIVSADGLLIGKVNVSADKDGSKHDGFQSETANVVSTAGGLGVDDDALNNDPGCDGEGDRLTLELLPETGIAITSVSPIQNESELCLITTTELNDEGSTGSEPNSVVTGENLTQVYIQATEANSPETGVSVVCIDVTYTKEIPTITTVTEVKTVEYSQDFTIPLTLVAVDQDGDTVTSDFHVTIDANNDRILNALSSDEARIVISEQITTTTVTELVNTDDASLLPEDNELVSGPVTTVTVGDEEVYDSNDVMSDGTSVDDIDDVLTDTALSLLPGSYTENDVIQGSASDDHLLSGGRGNDVMTGGAGSDTFAGGEGDDVILINLADTTDTGEDVDTVVDLELGDKIVIADLLVDDGGDMTVLLPDEGSNTSIVDSNGETEAGVTQALVIENVSSDDLTVSITLENTNIVEVKPIPVD